MKFVLLVFTFLIANFSATVMADSTDETAVETRQLSTEEAAALDLNSLVNAEELAASQDSDAGADDSVEMDWDHHGPGYGGFYPAPRPYPMPRPFPRPFPGPYPFPRPYPAPRPYMTCYAQNAYGYVYQSSGYGHPGILQQNAMSACQYSGNGYGCRPTGCR